MVRIELPVAPDIQTPGAAPACLRAGSIMLAEPQSSAPSTDSPRLTQRVFNKTWSQQMTCLSIDPAIVYDIICIFEIRGHFECDI